MKTNNATGISENVNSANIPTPYIIPQKRPYVIPARREPTRMFYGHVVMPLVEKVDLENFPKAVIKAGKISLFDKEN